MCLTEFRLGLTELPKNVKTEIFLPKLLFLIKILKNPHDRIHEMQFKKLCQEDFTIGPLLRVVFGKTFFKRIVPLTPGWVRRPRGVVLGE